MLEALRRIVREDGETAQPAARHRPAPARRRGERVASTDPAPIVDVAGALPGRSDLAPAACRPACCSSSRNLSDRYRELFGHLTADRPSSRSRATTRPRGTSVRPGPARSSRPTTSTGSSPRWARGAAVADVAPHGVERYTYAATQRLADEVEVAIGRRARRIGEDRLSSGAMRDDVNMTGEHRQAQLDDANADFWSGLAARMRARRDRGRLAKSLARFDRAISTSFRPSSDSSRGARRAAAQIGLGTGPWVSSSRSAASTITVSTSVRGRSG